MVILWDLHVAKLTRVLVSDTSAVVTFGIQNIPMCTLWETWQSMKQQENGTYRTYSLKVFYSCVFSLGKLLILLTLSFPVHFKLL